MENKPCSLKSSGFCFQKTEVFLSFQVNTLTWDLKEPWYSSQIHSDLYL